MMQEYEAPASIEITGTGEIGTIGATAQLSANVLPVGAPQRLSWTSLNTSVATISATGMVTATGYGSATIQAISGANSSIVGSATITVPEPAKKTAWTVLYYSDADCNLEAALMADIAEMKAGLRADADVNIILLVDRHPNSSSPYSGDATTLGSNFSDARLFRILPGSFIRIDGSTQFPEITATSYYEANMGDAATLEKFIEFGKANYPADHYALFISNHGDGVRSPIAEDIRSSIKGVCFDESNGNDSLYTAELTDVLDSSDSVDLLAFDACFMGALEIAYQYRPGNGSFSADYMVASAPTVWGAGFPYTKIFERFRTGGGSNGTSDTMQGGNEAYYDPATMTPVEFGAVIVEEQFDDTSANYSYGMGQSLSLFDLSKAAGVKTVVDEMSALLWAEGDKADLETVRGSGATANIIAYFNPGTATEWISFPYFDLYDLATDMAFNAAFSVGVKAKASALKTAIDDAIVYSFGNSDYSLFMNGKNGLSIFFPDGDRLYTPSGGSPTAMSAFQWWYNPIDTNVWWTGGHYYGKLSWCIDGMNPVANQVGNWFELMDCWFEAGGNAVDGGYNGVQW